MKQHYSLFLRASPDRLHFAAHSHHPWPDVTREAQLAAWDDAARHADHKWDGIFGRVVPHAQRHIARILGIGDASRITFAPNTHEFVVRLLSCFEPGRRLRVVTTDAEFFSFARQISRLEEEGLVEAVRVEAEPFATFPDRFVRAASHEANDLVFLSHVFFNSGYVVPDLRAIVDAAPRRSMVVIDGYHAFFAVPTNLGNLADRAFYLAGGYKYAQSGEGACFLAVPPAFDRLPLNTGWFAGFGALEGGETTRVGFAQDGSRFMGATFDPVGLYRFNAVADLFQREGVTIERVHAHVKTLQRLFVDGLRDRADAMVRAKDLLLPENGLTGIGHFLTFRTSQAESVAKTLASRNVYVDHRADRVRFGFGAYHDEGDVRRLLAML